MWAWLKNLFNNLLGIFKKFIDLAIPMAYKILAAQFKDIAVQIVTELAGTDLSNAEKREEAFKRIKAAIVDSGKEASDNFIYWLVETAYQYFQNH